MKKLNFKIPFSGVGAKYTEEEKAAVLNAMDTSTTYTQGPQQDLFQDKFANYVGTKYAFATSSAATALELSAILLDLKPGDEVICPAHTYCASAYPFAKYGANIVWADINSDTWVVDENIIANLITENTKAIIAVHLYGLPAPMPEIIDLVKDKNIIVIEDCAQAIGATIEGKQVGSFGDIGVFSFQSHKNISTLGEGGMMCLNNDKWAKVLPGLRHNGHAPYPADRDFYWKPAMNNVDFDLEGVWPNNFCIGEVQCALGVSMLPRIDKLNKDRRSRFYKFKEEFNSFEEIKLQLIPETYLSTHHLLPFQFKSKKMTSDKLIEILAFDYGIQAIVQYYPLNRYPLFKKAGFGHAVVPETDNFFDNMVSLPFHHWLSDDDFNFIISSLKKIISNNN